MPRKVKSEDKKKDVVRLTSAQDRRLTRMARYFQDHRDQWPGFVGEERARRLNIDVKRKPGRQALWLIALDTLLSEYRTFRGRD